MMYAKDFETSENSLVPVGTDAAPRLTRLSPFTDAAIVVQLLAIRDNHPQWRTNRREDGVIASHAYEAQLAQKAALKDHTTL